VHHLLLVTSVYACYPTTTGGLAEKLPCTTDEPSALAWVGVVRTCDFSQVLLLSLNNLPSEILSTVEERTTIAISASASHCCQGQDREEHQQTQ